MGLNNPISARTEALEPRRLFALFDNDIISIASLPPVPVPATASVSEGVCTIRGTPRPDDILITASADGSQYIVTTREPHRDDSTRVQKFPTRSIRAFRIDAGAGDDLIQFNLGSRAKFAALRNTLTGAGGNDTLTGTAGADRIEAGDGDDLVVSAGGKDRAYGGAGNDTINAGSGSDYVFAGAGDDNIKGLNGRDHLSGETGADSISGGSHADVIAGGDQSDEITGGKGNDLLRGHAGEDSLYGNDGNDQLWGEKGKDCCYGGAGDDSLYGGSDSDDLVGGTGYDSFDASSEDNAEFDEAESTGVVGNYTSGGDMNLDGQVTGDDYTVVDNNLNPPPAVGLEWLSGDMNLDGAATGDDYTVIDQKYLNP
jgi:Ca2+-binding RTX toxin-like protein